MPEDIIRVTRVIQYVGPRSWVEATVAKSIQGTKDVGALAMCVGNRKLIIGTTLGSFPDILSQEQQDAIQP
jgi:hypothetical protein